MALLCDAPFYLLVFIAGLLIANPNHMPLFGICGGDQLRTVSHLFAPVWALIPFFGLHAALVYVGKLNFFAEALQTG